jgi:hypothetical protein
MVNKIIRLLIVNEARIAFPRNIFLLSSMAVILLYCVIVHGEITGQKTARPGELARFTSDVEADWQVLPVENQGGVYVDSNRKTLIISSPNVGKVYIFAATVGKEGTPKADVIELEITDAEDVIVTPLPPVEPPSTTLDGIIADGTKTATAVEKQALANAFSLVCQAIDGKSITTATGARETFRKQWLIESSRAGAGTADKYAPLLDALSEELKGDDLANVRQKYEAVVRALGYTIMKGDK